MNVDSLKSSLFQQCRQALELIKSDGVSAVADQAIFFAQNHFAGIYGVSFHFAVTANHDVSTHLMPSVRIERIINCPSIGHVDQKPATRAQATANLS